MVLVIEPFTIIIKEKLGPWKQEGRVSLKSRQLGPPLGNPSSSAISIL